MSGSVNKAVIIGNLGRDPESRRTQSGEPVVNLSVATSESWKDKASGEKRERVEWHRVTIWNEGLCDVATKYLKKGSKVYLEGQLQTRKWTDQSGVEKYTTEIVLPRYRGTLVLLGDGGGQASEPVEQKPKGGGANTIPDELSDEIPFIICDPLMELRFWKKAIV